MSLDEAIFTGRLVTGARLGHGSGHLAMTTDKGSGKETLQVGEELLQHSVQPSDVELAESEQFDGIALLQVLLDVVRIAVEHVEHVSRGE